MKSKLIKSITEGVAALLVVVIGFVLLEPAISMGATSAQSTFTISQVVTAEVAFGTAASNVTLSPSLGGITGGTSNGGTQVIVLTNDKLGYTMTILASSSVGMIGNSSSSQNIPAYIAATANVPDYNFTVPANRARFGYTVEASTTQDLVQAFKDNGSACNQAAGGDTLDQCWLNASTSAFTIINRNFQTPASGATSTIKFRVQIQSSPSPTIPDDTYVATTTLTVTTN